MNILIISGSPRAGGNTEIMADAFAKGAKESGNTVTMKKMSELTVAPCRDCESCFSHNGVCAQHDDMAGILEAFDKADMVVFASPVYWSNVSAQLKAVVDRLFAREQKGFHPTCAALLLDSGSPGVYTAPVTAYKETLAYLKWQDKGIVTISGMVSKGAMEKSADLKKAYELGKSIC